MVMGEGMHSAIKGNRKMRSGLCKSIRCENLEISGGHRLPLRLLFRGPCARISLAARESGARGFGRKGKPHA